jgi:hypothetical protein
MVNDQLEHAVRSFVNLLVELNYSDAVSHCSDSRLSGEDLEKVIRDYGRTLIEPPAHAYKDLDSIAVTGVAIATWSVVAPLWTSEEGLSDLSLELTVRQNENTWIIQLDDLHVL